MATWTKAKLANQTLEYMGVKPAGQSAYGPHVNLVKTYIDSTYDGLQDSGLAPYGIATIPEWAWIPMMELVAFRVGPRFGKRYPPTQEEQAIKKMAISVFGGPKGELPVRSKGY